MIREDYLKEIYESDRGKTLRMYGAELPLTDEEAQITNPSD